MMQTVARAFAFRMSRATAFAALTLVACAAGDVRAKLVVMHGYADVTSALVWIQAESPGPVQVSWRVEGSDAARSTSLDARAVDENIVVARVTGLVPGGRATYRIEGDGDVREGIVRAQPLARGANAPDITIAIGSCFFLGDPDPRFARPGYGGGFAIFDAIADKKPDVMLWLGDNVYLQRPDFLDPVSMAARHRTQRAFPPLARLLTATSHLAIWDDHDFGWNNANASYPLKAESLRLFKLYWANPSYGLPEAAGIFGYAPYGDVDLFLLDGRSYRTQPRLQEPGGSLFGAAQFAWLRASLLGSLGRIRIVANGSQFWNAASRFEGLHEYPDEQRSLADFLVSQRVGGLLFLSGDRHFGELLRVDRPAAYPLYEFTSSPLTSSPWEKPEARERDNPQVVPGTLVGKRQFGLIRITGPADDRRIALEAYDETGALLWRHDLRANDLEFAR
jgi:alkaline phosphatase D